MAFSFDPNDDNDIDEVFDELREKLLQLDRKNVQNDQQEDEINRLLIEKAAVCRENENLKSTNQKLQAELQISMRTTKEAEARNRDNQEQRVSLMKNNEGLIVENEKLTITNRQLLNDFTELQKKYSNILEKVSVWHKIHTEVSQKEAQNQTAMLETAKQIGHAQATSLYAHQLLQQVDVVYNNAIHTFRHLRESRESIRTESEGLMPTTLKKRDPQEASGWSNAELNWKDVDGRLRTDLQSYKEQLWTGLQALTQPKDSSLTVLPNT